ncbi:MAG: hypothetical protein LBQ52_04280, partial [Helicobacteraceae bacterium]|nr:hypothetical protein [Helicobacteraceae bacterium]
MFVGCGGGGSSGGGGDNPPPTSSEYLVSFYDANLDSNGSIRVQANSSIDIARLKSELNLNAAALYLANDTTDRINNASYQVTQNVNFYAIPSVQEIRTEGQLAAIRTDYKTLNGDYILMNDITLTSATLDDSAGWHPIGDDLALAYSFRGIFNGNGY